MALAEHITDGGITDVTIQKIPESIVWMTVGDAPYLVSLAYNRDQDVLAAAKHQVGGSGVVESVAVMPGDEEDEVWLSILRTIDGSAVRYIEQMQPWDFGDQEDAWFVDSGLQYLGAATNTVTGLEHLEGETVTTLAEGTLREDAVVSGGSITLLDTFTQAQVGKRYRYTAQPMKLNQSTDTVMGSNKQISEVDVNFLETLNAQYGKDTDNLYDMLWPRPSDFDPIDLYTGEQKLAFPGGFSSEDELVISGADPYPCMIRSIVALVEKVGR